MTTRIRFGPRRPSLTAVLESEDRELNELLAQLEIERIAWREEWTRQWHRHLLMPVAWRWSWYLSRAIERDYAIGVLR